MTIDLYSAAGTKTGTLELPSALFGAPINRGLMHEALIRQQSNRRHPIAHAKHRGEVVGSTKKMYQQKHTGRARRGPIRSPLLKGGGKAFGPRNEANFTKNMPRKMRRGALFSCLSYQAKKGVIIGLEGYPETVKTKALMALLRKLPVEGGRRTVIVTPGLLRGLELSARNIPGVVTLRAMYLNPEDILSARHIILMKDAIGVMEATFTQHTPSAPEAAPVVEAKPAPKKKKAPSAEKSTPAPKKKSSPRKKATP